MDSMAQATAINETGVYSVGHIRGLSKDFQVWISLKNEIIVFAYFPLWYAAYVTF